MELSGDERDRLLEKIESLKVQHRDLDDIIGRLARSADMDELQLRRLKRRKLLLKDEITLLERQLVPDIPA
ncbi:MAG: YdcH family protein [Burkholderiales bacterium]